MKAKDREIVAIMVLIPLLFALGLFIGYTQGVSEHSKHCKLEVSK